MWQRLRCGKNETNILLLTVLFSCVFSFFGTSGAMQFGLGPDTSLDCDVTITYGAGFRVSDRDEDLLTINTDDANRNFDQWDMINNKLTVFADIDLKHKNFGLFVRPKAFYDHVYMTDNANDSPETNNALVGGIINSSDEWAEKIEDIHGRNAEILDLFGYLSFNLSGRDIDLRVGKQVISWGESLMISGGISSAQSPTDASAAVAVGTEVKEIYMPTESVYLQVGITPNLGLSGYYQWKWEKSRLMEGGTFFSQADMLDEIKAPSLTEVGSSIYAIRRGEDNEARDDGQYGVALTYILPWFNDTEVGVYYINYHSKSPLLLMGRSGGRTVLYSSFIEDIKLYGASVSSIIGVANVSGEFSYRQDIGFRGSDAVGRPVEEIADYWQAQVSTIYMKALKYFAESVTLTGEVGCGKEVDREENEFAWKYAIRAGFDWYQVLPLLDITMNLAYSDVPEGTNLIGSEDTASASIGFNFTYKNKLSANITYENRLKENAYEDRDTIALKLSYGF